MNFDLLAKVAAPYLLLSAIRGADVGANEEALDEIKIQVTARVRALVFDEGECFGYYVNEPLSIRSLQVVRDAMDKLDLSDTGEGNKHFLRHLADAVEQTKNEAIWSGHAQILIELLHTDSKWARKQMLDTYMREHTPQI